METFINNLKILAVFILVDALVTMLMMAATGASFVMMNSITFKMITTLISIAITAVGFTVYERKQS